MALLRRSRIVVLGVVALAIVVALVAWWRSRESEAPTYRFATVERGPITATVSTTGTLNPVTSVQVGTQVSGQIKELFVDFNSPVKQGQLIARIDPETFLYRVRQAQADVEAARSTLNRAQVSLINADRELKRTRELVARNFVSAAEQDAKQSTYDLAQAEVATARATVAQRDAQLASARVDLARTEIKAPVDGVVIKRSVDVGQTVAASLQSPELFVIAKDLRDMQVDTSIDEADVGRMRIGLRATFSVDAFPGRTFSGEVRQIRKSAQNVQNVITYTVLVTAANPAGDLIPGMTANVRIVTDSRPEVLKIANAALRYRPTGEAANAAAKAGAGGSEKGNGREANDGRGADSRGGAPGGAGASGGAGGGQAGNAAQMRERLVAELGLDAGQQAKLDPIFGGMREKFMALRDLPEEQRAKAGASIRADMRARIEEILTPEQKLRYAALTAEMAGRPGGGNVRGRVWIIDAGKPKPIDVRIGLTDGTSTEVSGDGIAEGVQVIVGQQGGASSAPAQKGSPPRMFF